MPERPPRADVVVDTSAVMAFLLGEATREAIGRAVDRARSPIMSAATFTELLIVAEARGGQVGSHHARQFVLDAAIDLIPVDHLTSLAAHDAWQTFGKGRHPAALNLGDCFSYALAAHFELPLLCVGNDFARTDIEVVDLAAV